MPFFEPNSFNGPVEDHRFDEPPLKLSGDAARYNHREGNDDYRQAGDLFRLIGKEAHQRYPPPSGIFRSGYGITHDGNLETQLEKFPQCEATHMLASMPARMIWSTRCVPPYGLESGGVLSRETSRIQRRDRL
jgi:hypothetical protein